MKSSKISVDIIALQKIIAKMFEKEALPIIEKYCVDLSNKYLEKYTGDTWIGDVPSDEPIPFDEYFNRCSDKAMYDLYCFSNAKRLSSNRMANAILRASTGNPLEYHVLKSLFSKEKAVDDFIDLVEKDKLNNGKYKVVFAKVEEWKTKDRNHYYLAFVNDGNSAGVGVKMSSAKEDLSILFKLKPESDQV